MPAPAQYTKGPGDRLDYTIAWSKWLAGDQITASTWTVPAGAAVAGSSFTETTTTAWIEGGTVGASYRVVNRITTAAGRIVERTIVIKIEAR